MRLTWTAFRSSRAVQNSTYLPKLLKFAPQKPQNGVVSFWIHKKKNSTSCQYSLNILSSFSPLRCNRRESVSTRGGEDVSGDNVVAAATATTAGVVGVDWSWEESIELPVLTKARMVIASLLTSGGTVGRASKRQRGGGDEPIRNVTRLGSLSRVSKLSMTDHDLISYFNARLEGTDMAMECANMACDCLSILDDKNVRQAVATFLVWFKRKSKFEQDSVLMEWYRYAHPGTEKANFFQLPFDGNSITNLSVKKSIHCHKLCQSGMQLVMSIGDTRM